MRSDVVLISVFLAMGPAFGHGRTLVVPKPAPYASQNHISLDLSNFHLHLFHQPNTDDTEASTPAGPGATWSQQKSAPDISMGSLHARFGADDNPRANLSSYKLLGMDQLGSSIWHNQQGRSAKLLFVWPTDK